MNIYIRHIPKQTDDNLNTKRDCYLWKPFAVFPTLAHSRHNNEYRISRHENYAIFTFNLETSNIVKFCLLLYKNQYDFKYIFTLSNVQIRETN